MKYEFYKLWEKIKRIVTSKVKSLIEKDDNINAHVVSSNNIPRCRKLTFSQKSILIMNGFTHRQIRESLLVDIITSYSNKNGRSYEIWTIYNKFSKITSEVKIYYEWGKYHKY